MQVLDWSSSTRRALGTLLVAGFALVLGAEPATAKVFFSRNEALELAFPKADRIEDETVILESEQVERVQKLARGPLDSKLVRIYTGYRQGEVLGYAFIDVHNVRTHPEAFLVVLDPSGAVRTLRVLAFHEPLEYMPTSRWYTQFEDKSLAESLRVGRDIHGIVGATLSAQATARGVRRALALYQVVVARRD